VRLLPLAAGALIAACIAPAIAQDANPAWIVPVDGTFSGLSTPVPLAYSDRAENPAVTSVAKRTYVQLASGALDRAHLSADLNAALTPQAVAAASQQLIGLGAPQWAFVENAQAPAGEVSIYRLEYASRVAYLTFGVTDNGTIYAVALGADMPR
jgi:hypothetical protein